MIDEFYYILSILSIKTEVCESNYCKNGIDLFLDSEYYPDGHYYFHSYVNNRPYFEMEFIDPETNFKYHYGIWWNNGYWLFGPASLKGQLLGSAYYAADDYCPHQLNKKPWGVAGPTGFSFCDDCYVKCKYCIFIIKILWILLQKYSWGLHALL